MLQDRTWATLSEGTRYHFSRMLWSFSRDGGVPLYRVWAAVNRRTRTPTNAVWAMTALAFLLGLPMLHSLAAFQAIGSISSVGLWFSCETSPLLCQLEFGSCEREAVPPWIQLHRPFGDLIKVEDLYRPLAWQQCVPSAYPLLQGLHSTNIKGGSMWPAYMNSSSTWTVRWV